MLEEEEEALRNHCRRMTSRVRNKQQHLRRQQQEEEEEEARGGEVQDIAGDEFRDRRKCPLPLPDCAARETARTSHELICQGPEVQTVPLQLLSLLRLKTAKEKIARAAEVELHGPAGCSVCEQEQASLALRSFIRRKKTQLQFQTLKGRLNTLTHAVLHKHTVSLTTDICVTCPDSRDLNLTVPAVCTFGWGGPADALAGFGRNYSVEMCGSQQPVVALATTKERGVALATDEMRGYPDKKATGTHLERPRCPFSDR